MDIERLEDISHKLDTAQWHDVIGPILSLDELREIVEALVYKNCQMNYLIKWREHHAKAVTATGLTNPVWMLATFDCSCECMPWPVISAVS